MKKLIAKWLVESAIDDNRTHKLPGWVAKLVIRDGKLASDIDQQQQLIDGLKNAAPAWVDAHTNHSAANVSTSAPSVASPVASSPQELVRLHTPDAADQPRSLMRWSSVAAAACVLIATVAAFNMNTSKTDPQPAAPSVSAFKVEEVRDALNRSESIMRKLTSEAQEIAAVAPAVHPSELGKLTTQYVEEAGSMFGRGLAVLNRSGR